MYIGNQTKEVSMEKWLMKRAAVYQLIKLVDENDGNITINTDKVKRVFNDEDDIVRIEYVESQQHCKP